MWRKIKIKIKIKERKKSTRRKMHIINNLTVKLFKFLLVHIKNQPPIKMEKIFCVLFRWLFIRYILFKALYREIQWNESEKKGLHGIFPTMKWNFNIETYLNQFHYLPTVFGSH